MAQVQAALGDEAGALDSLLDLAQTIRYLHNKNSELQFNYLVMQSVIRQLPANLSIDDHDLEVPTLRYETYCQAVLAALSNDLPMLTEATNELRGDSNQSHLARALAELAVLYARRGYLDDYRTARSGAVDLIHTGTATARIRLVLAEADALAGERELAENGIVAGSLVWYGSSERPSLQLVLDVAGAGNWYEAEMLAKKMTAQSPYYRLRAWDTVACARVKDPNTRPPLLEWLNSLERPEDRVGALCGLAKSAESAPSSPKTEAAQK